MAKEKTNKERLICMESMLDRVLEWQSNHMEHHKILYDRIWRLFLVIMGSCLGLLTSVISAYIIYKMIKG